MRYERKYRIEHASLEEVRQVVRLNPGSFQTTFPDRYINSIYLDTAQFDALNDNLSGISDRVKFRIRWYGEDWLKAEKPILEKKIKQNLLGTKAYKNLPDFDLNTNFSLKNYIQEEIEGSKGLFPVVMVRYLRSYYVSFDQKVRATIDRSLCYYFFNGDIFYAGQPVKDPAIILEIKYAEADENAAILQRIPFRLTKNSKFVQGVFAGYY